MRFELEHEDAVEVQDGLRVLLQMNQVLISHVLSAGDQEVAHLAMERGAAHAMDDEIQINIFSANEGIECALVLSHVMLDEELAVFFLEPGHPLLLTQTIGLTAKRRSCHRLALLHRTAILDTEITRWMQVEGL